MNARDEERLNRLEERVYFQEQELEALNGALVRQQAQLDEAEKRLADACLMIRVLRELLHQQGEGPENALPPHYMPERY